MTEVLIIEPNETVLKSIIKDGYTLLTQLILLYLSILTGQTGWTIFAFILVAILAVSLAHKRLKSNRFKSSDAAIKYLRNRY